MPQRILITGFMGAGKTTVAVALAESLGCQAVDLDQSIVEREGRAIHELIAMDGEASFRETETEALQDALTRNTAGVIALGGGAWIIERNRLLIHAHQGYTVWLDAPFDLCWQRITSGEAVRPLAQNREQSGRLYTERRALYELADLRVAGTEAGRARSAPEMAAEIQRSFVMNKAGT